MRERKKQATRESLRLAALRLALERGPENVRVDDIADAAGVSPRTYNNYFSSREQAIVAAIIEDREERIAAAVTGRPASVSLSEAVIDAVVEQYTDPSDSARDALLMITTSPGLLNCYADAAGSLAEPLTDAFTEGAIGIDPVAARVLAASVGAAAKIAVREWLQSGAGATQVGDFVVTAGSLPDLIRKALLPLVPALDAATADSGAAAP
ncbi:TetR/AcrR family transcriptional regulator [Nonomuraea diastatica]|uniref:TetR/AcrR family transcriptional regulator n=1 Tax=Nonomuraea diastatica TaxID=1848329 RepID=A0A4R4VPW0_9ACTN|nr:TetR/AcrR family transcriptional regulator [Nonomuraea diastatica]